jgi:hypothetical protein
MLLAREPDEKHSACVAEADHFEFSRDVGSITRT